MTVVEETLARMVRAIRYKSGHHGPVPANTIPTPKELWAWAAHCPQDAHDAAYDLTVETCEVADEVIREGEHENLEELQALLTNVMLSMIDTRSSRASDAADDSDEWVRIHMTDRTSFDTRITATHLPIDLRALCELHDLLPADKKPKHPLGPLVRAWLNRPVALKLDRHRDGSPGKGIIPAPFANRLPIAEVIRPCSDDMAANLGSRGLPPKPAQAPMTSPRSFFAC